MTTLGGGMIQLSLFPFPDEAPVWRPKERSHPERWDNWWLAMLRGPRSFPDDDEEQQDWHGAGDAPARQASFAGFP
jgi:hypothetical protein